MKKPNRKRKARGKRPRRSVARQEPGRGQDEAASSPVAPAARAGGWSGRRTLVAAAVVVAVAVAIVLWLETRGSGAGGVSVTVPTLSAVAEVGRAAFGQRCAACHGAHAGGTDKGPPLVHTIYRPGHHADDSIVKAIRRGTRAHHWRFGDMPPQPAVSEVEIRPIIAYVRELQRANGVN